jgi:hypothetical protein
MELADLVDHAEISQLKYAYLRCLDQKDWDGIAALFVPDATASYSGGAYHYEGADQIVTFMRTNMSAAQFHTCHRAHHPEIVVSGDEASATWAFDDVNVDPERDFYLTGAGFYEDRYRRVAGEWLISHTGYRRTFETIMSMSKVGMALTASWWGTDGRSILPVAPNE